MRQQPPWSDVPTVLLTRDKVDSVAAVEALESFRNITLLDRPSSTRSLLSAVKSALRARQRQYQIRDQLVARRAAEGALRDADKRKDEFLATHPAAELRGAGDQVKGAALLFLRSQAGLQAEYAHWTDGTVLRRRQKRGGVVREDQGEAV